MPSAGELRSQRSDTQVPVAGPVRVQARAAARGMSPVGNRLVRVADDLDQVVEQGRGGSASSPGWGCGAGWCACAASLARSAISVACSSSMCSGCGMVMQDCPGSRCTPSPATIRVPLVLAGCAACAGRPPPLTGLLSPRAMRDCASVPTNQGGADVRSLAHQLGKVLVGGVLGALPQQHVHRARALVVNFAGMP